MSIFRKAERRKAKLRLAITGPAGSGKSYGALLVAFGIGGKIALLDTENGSGDLYSSLGAYDVCSINAPFTVQKYIDAIKDAEISGYDVLILDSISAEWAGTGGLLNLHTQITSANRANSYAAWGQITPKHNAFIDAIISSNLHIIATIRSKTEYAQVQNERGKTEIKKMGLGLVQRDGIDYGGVELASYFFRGNMTAYINNLIHRDLERNLEKYREFKTMMEEINQTL